MTPQDMRNTAQQAINELEKCKLLYNCLFWDGQPTRDKQAEYMAHNQRAINLLKQITK